MLTATMTTTSLLFNFNGTGESFQTSTACWKMHSFNTHARVDNEPLRVDHPWEEDVIEGILDKNKNDGEELEQEGSNSKIQQHK